MSRFLPVHSLLNALPYLSQKAVHKHLFELTEAVHPVYALYVKWGIPWGVEDDDPVGSGKVDAKRAGFCWDEKQTSTDKKTKQNNKQAALLLV